VEKRNGRKGTKIAIDRCWDNMLLSQH
jgi:hypothetical protein